MNHALTLKSLYAVNGIVALLMYVPQFINAWKDRNSACSISLLTFGGWGIGSAITVLYAWLSVGDRMFTVVSLGNLIGCGAIFCLVATRRLLSRRTNEL
jgi:uncharacterized protein with PQ loop repeat